MKIKGLAKSGYDNPKDVLPIFRHLQAPLQRSQLGLSKNSWSIEYYFPGPDLRYNGTSVSVKSSDVEKYIQAFINNWEEFGKLKESIPKGGEYSKFGEMGMTIRIGGFAEGICIRSYHMPIRTKERLDEVIQSYKYALERAEYVRGFLSKL